MTQFFMNLGTASSPSLVVKFLRCVMCWLGITCTVESSQAEVVLRHVGNSDPASEGWFLDTQFGTVGPIDDDGTAAWVVQDTVSSFNSPAYTIYVGFVSGGQIAKGQTNGWRLSARLKIPGADTQVGGSPSISYRNGLLTFELCFGADQDGDPLVKIITQTGTPSPIGQEIKLTGVGPGYHDYSLVYDPDELAATCFVDGRPFASGYRGWRWPGFNVYWGAISSADTGEGRFASVVYEAFDAKPARLRATASGLEISGTVGTTYRIESTTDLKNWALFEELKLTNSPSLITPVPQSSSGLFFRAVFGP